MINSKSLIHPRQNYFWICWSGNSAATYLLQNLISCHLCDYCFLLIRIDILKAFLIHLLPLHAMKISQSDLWVQTLHKWLYSQGVVHPRFLVSYRCVPVIDKSNTSCTGLNVSIHLLTETLSLFLPNVFWTSEPIH